MLRSYLFLKSCNKGMSAQAGKAAVVKLRRRIARELFFSLYFHLQSYELVCWLRLETAGESYELNLCQVRLALQSCVHSQGTCIKSTILVSRERKPQILPALNEGVAFLFSPLSSLSLIFPAFSSCLVLSCLKLWCLSPHCSQN